MGTSSQTLSLVPQSDVQTKVEEALAALTPVISKAFAETDTQATYVSTWEARIRRAEDVLGRVKPEGKDATEILLKQAQACLLMHQEKLETTRLALDDLNAQSKELHNSLDKLKAHQEEKELRLRIQGISDDGYVEDSNQSFSLPDVRELERTIHTVKALIELRGTQ